MIHDDLVTAGLASRRYVRKSMADTLARRHMIEARPEVRARRTASVCGMPIEIPNHPRPDRCECCGETSKTTLHLDHCHDSGRFRGWVCSSCNLGTGRNDDARWHDLRAAFLRKPFQTGSIQWAYPAQTLHVASETKSFTGR